MVTVFPLGRVGGSREGIFGQTAPKVRNSSYALVSCLMCTEPQRLGTDSKDRGENRSSKGRWSRVRALEGAGQGRAEAKASVSLALSSCPSARQRQAQQTGGGQMPFTGLSGTVHMLPTTCFFGPLGFPAAVRGPRSLRVPLGLGHERTLLGHGLSPVTACTCHSMHTPSAPSGQSPCLPPSDQSTQLHQGWQAPRAGHAQPGHVCKWSRVDTV